MYSWFSGFPTRCTMIFGVGGSMRGKRGLWGMSCQFPSTKPAGSSSEKQVSFSEKCLGICFSKFWSSRLPAENCVPEVQFDVQLYKPRILILDYAPNPKSEALSSLPQS